MLSYIFYLKVVNEKLYRSEAMTITLRQYEQYDRARRRSMCDNSLSALLGYSTKLHMREL